MTEIAPLKALRYAAERFASDAPMLVAPPYDVIGDQDRADLEAVSAENVVHLILPRGDGDAKYTDAGARFRAWEQSGIFQRDEEPAFYSYTQRFQPPGRPGAQLVVRRGFLALVRLAPFSERIVLPHERTLAGPKLDRLMLFRQCVANLSPGFMLYEDPTMSLDGVLDGAKEIARFTTHDGIEHVLGRISDEASMAQIAAQVRSSKLLIADGHHRYETAVAYRDEVRAAHGGTVDEAAESEYFMCFLANGADPGLLVFPTHRVVHALPSFDSAALLVKLSDYFEIKEFAGEPLRETIEARLRISPEIPTFVLYAAGFGTKVLRLRSTASLGDHPVMRHLPEPLRSTDVAVLHGAIFEHALGITKEAQAAKTNLKYVQAIDDGLLEVSRGKGQLFVAMNPTPVKTVRAVSESGEVMPQKSTYFYPKVLTGLAFHTLQPERRVHRIV